MNLQCTICHLCHIHGQPRWEMAHFYSFFAPEHQCFPIHFSVFFLIFATFVLFHLGVDPFLWSAPGSPNELAPSLTWNHMNVKPEAIKYQCESSATGLQHSSLHLCFEESSSVSLLKPGETQRTLKLFITVLFNY